MGRTDESDEQLMQRVVRGDQESLSILLRRYANPLLTFVRRMSGDHHHSEDLFQDVFLAVWKHRRRYQYPRSFRSWLFGIAANKCRSEYRSRSHQLVSLNNAAVSQQSSPAASPVQGAIATETEELVERAVMRLPPQQRTVVVLRLWNGFSYTVISGILELQESTVRSHMVHGLESMREFLEPRLR